MTNGTYNAPALRQGLKLIGVLAEAGRPLGLSEIARLGGTNKNMATRLLATLVDEGWAAVEQPGPKYHLTLLPFTIASKPVNRLTLKELALGPLHELWEDLGESVYLGVPHGSDVLYLEHFDGVGPVRIAGRVGGMYPLHCTAPGKALLAFGGENVLTLLSKKALERFTDATITDKVALRKELALARQAGFALDREEYGRGLLCLAAPVLDPTQVAVGAIGVSVTMLHYTVDSLIEKLGPKVMATAAEISKRMGCVKQIV